MPVFLHNKQLIEAFLRQDEALHVYELGDLDDFFWPFTQWLAAEENAQTAALFMLYSGGGLPILLACAEGETQRSRLSELLKDSLPLLPRRFYLHLSPGIVNVFRSEYPLEAYGLFLKMRLADPTCLEPVDCSETVQILPPDLGEVEAFYEAAYPQNAFDPRMLETGCYYGIRRGGQLVSLAGIHVVSSQYRVAALGNITTHPQYRGQGLGTAVTARVCKELLKQVDVIGLNVRANNTPALACYRKLGFVPVAEYEEWMIGE